jgi:hypothetical protein
MTVAGNAPDGVTTLNGESQMAIIEMANGQ